MFHTVLLFIALPSVHKLPYYDDNVKNNSRNNITVYCAYIAICWINWASPVKATPIQTPCSWVGTVVCI